jgi:hypothetical protein
MDSGWYYTRFGVWDHQWLIVNGKWLIVNGGHGRKDDNEFGKSTNEERSA